jgi:S1-C subfamily serine protease
VVRFVREGKPQSVKVMVAEQPADLGNRKLPPVKNPQNIENIGVEVGDLTRAWETALGFNSKAKGALVTKVVRTGLAALKGVRPGMVVTAVDRKKVTSAKEAADALDASSLKSGIRLKLLTQSGKSIEVVIRPTEME